MKRRILPGILSAAMLVTAGSFANATTRTWDGSVDQNWFSAGNWDPSDAHPQANTFFIGSNAFLLLNIASSQLECRELIVTDNGQLEVWSGATNSVSPDYGAWVNVTGDIRVDSNAWINTTSDLTNGGSVLIKARNVLLTGGLSGGIDASGRGFGGQLGYGPGATDGAMAAAMAPFSFSCHPAACLCSSDAVGHRRAEEKQKESSKDLGSVRLLASGVHSCNPGKDLPGWLSRMVLQAC